MRIVFLLFTTVYSAWALGLATDDSVPEGFESLAGPRPMFVDVIFSDRVVGTALVIVEGDTLTFDEPRLILDMLDSVVPNDGLRNVLSSPLSSNTDRLCYRPADPAGCGSLNPDLFAVLFDEDALQVTLFVNPALQQVRSDKAARYLEPPQRRGSAILSFDAAASSIGGKAWAYGFRSESWFGYGRGYVRSILGFNSELASPRLDSLALVHRLQDYELVAGSYAFTAGPALSSFNVLGLRLSTSLQTRVDTERARGSELSVLLDRRAIIQLYVDERLYSTQSLDAGHIAVDTTDLPDGSMEVEVRILDPVSGERTEYHRFTRSTLLPTRDETAMEFSIGAPLQSGNSSALPQIHRTGVSSIRLARRTGENTALGLGFSHLGKVDLLQPDFVLLGRHLTFQTSASLGFNGELGMGLRGVWNRGLFTASISGEWFDYGSATPTESVSAANKKPWLPDETGSLSVTLDRVFGRTSIGLYGSVRREYDGPQFHNTTGMGIGLRHRLFERARFRSSLSARLRLEGGDFNASLDMRISFGDSSRLTSLSAGLATSDSSSSSTTQSSEGAFQSVFGLESRWRGQQQDEWQFEGGLWANGGSPGTTVGVDAGVGHTTFNADIQSQWREQNGTGSQRDSQSDTALNLSTQIVLDRSGMAFAGNDAVRAGFVVDVDGEPVGTEYDILVNNASVATGRVGTPEFVALPPFARYEIQLEPRSLLASTFERENFEITLYPGNILRIHTVARERFLLITTVVDSIGDLLSNATLTRDEGPLMIGADGLLQVETSRGEKFQVRQDGGISCELTVPTDFGKEEVVVLDSPLVCK